jgi:hypothetical protein
MVLLPALASATPIFGTFGISGPGVLVFQNTGADFIRFCTQADTTCSGAATATGDFGVSGPGSNTFSVLTNADVGTILNVTDHTPPASPYTYLPPGAAVSIDNYLVVTGHPTWDFTATLLELATCTTTATQQCVGPFQLNASNGNVSVTMNVLGTITNTADNSKSTFDAILTGQYANTDIATVTANAQTPGGVFSNSWSGTIIASAASVPEPSTASMVGIGFGLVALGMFRRRNKART